MDEAPSRTMNIELFPIFRNVVIFFIEKRAGAHYFVLNFRWQFFRMHPLGVKGPFIKDNLFNFVSKLSDSSV